MFWSRGIEEVFRYVRRVVGKAEYNTVSKERLFAVVHDAARVTFSNVDQEAFWRRQMWL